MVKSAQNAECKPVFVQQEIWDDKTQMCPHRLASRATKTLNPMFVFQTTMYFWKIYETGEKNVHFHGAWRPSDVACFPTMSVSPLVSCEIMVRKQLRLTWYLRKLKNGRAHGSLQRGNQLCDFAARLFWFSSSVRTGSRVCRREKNTAELLNQHIAVTDAFS